MLSRLQYEVLHNKFWTPIYRNPLTADERKELERFVRNADDENGTASFWHSRFKWDSYWDNAIMFGVTKQYRKTPQKVLYFYEAVREGNKIYYVETDYDWRRYASHIMAEYRTASIALNGDEIINNALMPSLYYQNGVRVTLPRDYQKDIMRWLSEVIKGNETEADFPFKDEVILNSGFNFHIDLNNTVIHPFREAEEQAKMTANLVASQKKKAADKHSSDLLAAGFKSGDRVTTKEFNTKGFDKFKLIRMKDKGLINSVSRGLYEVV